MGKTPAHETLNSMDDVLKLLLGLVDALASGEPFLVIGHSYGGYLARGIAKQRPEQTAGLAMFCPVVDADNPSRRAAEHVVQQDSGDFDGLLEPEMEQEFRGYFVVQTRDMAKRFQEAVVPGVKLVDNAGLERVFGQALQPSPDDLPAFTKPTLLVTGRFDSTVGYVEQQELIDQYPRGTFAVLDRAGHALPHEQPALVNALLDDWLDRVTG
jgi:pimeloyl-ACP methyl ester carboxylesterase